MRPNAWLWSCALLLVSFSVAVAQAPAAGQANSDPVYQQLRHLAVGSEALTVNNVVLKRDAGTFTFATGTICFAAPVQGKVTAAVFSGNGSFVVTPPTEGEKQYLKVLTGNQPFNEEFNQLVLRFTDSTYDDLKKAPGVSPGGSCSADLLNENANTLRHELHYNLSGRILQDVLSEGPGGLFVAFIKGRKYSGRMLYVMDPHGATPIPGDSMTSRLPSMDCAPEEVMLLTYDEDKFGVWSAFHFSPEYAAGTASSAEQNDWIDIEKQEIDASFDKGAKLNGKATTTFLSRVNGLRVVPFDLFPSLRIQSVTDGTGQPLAFIQEDKNDDPQYFVILPKGLGGGDRFSVVTTYSGKDAVSNEGDGNYYPVARHNWYPNGRLEDYATYDMRFALPKGLTMVAAGERVSETTEGSQVLSRWVSPQPQTVAGFQFGKFKKVEAKLPKLDFAVESYANTETPDVIKNLQNSIEQAERSGVKTMTTLQSISTATLVENALSEAKAAVPLYTDYFGPAPFKRLALTQQTASNYGQAWPELVWLPMSYFWDSTIRHQIGYDDPRGYFLSVVSHEIAHEWWGHTVTWASYRDQWMSEGFAQTSASLFLQATQPNNKKYLQFWNDLRKELTDKNKEGYRPIDVAPVTLGYRSVNTKSGMDIYNRLVYTKGAYILHMIRMMMWNPKTGDAEFKKLMQDFVKTYTNRPATTEDFKAMLDKHMLPSMDVAGNHRMDWFFNEYVYGTALPHYKLDFSFRPGQAGPTLSFKLTQSGVDDNFAMIVPLYLELADGRVVRLGTAAVVGNKTIEQQVPLTGMKETPKRLVLNYYYDVLSSTDSK